MRDTSAPSAPPPLPLTRPNPFDPPEPLHHWSGSVPIRRMTYPDGHVGWLVTGFDAGRQVLADARFSPRVDRNHAPMGPPEPPEEALPAPPGFFIVMDPPDHTRYRKLLTGQFTVRRMRRLEERIARIVCDHLDAMEAAGPPADLVESFALPIPSLVICELLGVPYAERDAFQRDSSAVLNFSLTEQEQEDALQRINTYLRELVNRKRVEPQEDLISGLTAHSELTDEEISGMGSLLLIAGHETTAKMLSLGTLALLDNPAQLAEVRDRPGRVDTAVEELLRYLSVVFVLVRTPDEDVEVAGEIVRAGETVTVSLSAANRDPARYGEGTADRLDVTAGQPGHLAFGHGIHQCLGQQLARTEMRVAFPALLRRFPGLRLAVPQEEVPLRTDSTVYGAERLPVTW